MRRLTQHEGKVMALVSRKDEITILQQMLDSNRPEFLCLYGRRRVGKTFLIREFFENKKIIFFNVTGAKDAPMAEQLQHFMEELGKAFYHGAKLQNVKNWNDAFNSLTQALASSPANKSVVLFFDELPWMATKRSRLLQNLDYYWNQHWSRDKRIKLIVCGSSASWILRKIVRNKGGLYNRMTREIHLEPLNLPETKIFLAQMGIQLNHQQVLLLYMVTGGIPYYLIKAEKGLTAIQIIEKLAFSKNGFFLKEFDNLFSSLFDDNDAYIDIVRKMGKYRHGIGQQELLNTFGKHAQGGAYIRKLKNLEETGFIMSYVPLFHKEKGIYYRVTDEYVLFYLKWIEPIRKNLQKAALSRGNWQAMQNTAEWNNWLGYAFENICYKHLSAIREALNISPTAMADSWRYVPRKGDKAEGAQIDLLFDRKDNAITICEIKYNTKPYVITKDYVNNLRRKMDVFKKQTRTKKQLFIVMITTMGLKNNFYVEELLSGVITLEDLFK